MIDEGEILAERSRQVRAALEKLKAAASIAETSPPTVEVPKPEAEEIAPQPKRVRTKKAG